MGIVSEGAGAYPTCVSPGVLAVGLVGWVSAAPPTTFLNRSPSGKAPYPAVNGRCRDGA